MWAVYKTYIYGTDRDNLVELLCVCENKDNAVAIVKAMERLYKDFRYYERAI